MKPLPTYFNAAFNNMPRCCWNDGETGCRKHVLNPRLAGTPEWLRFIHNVMDVLVTMNGKDEGRKLNPFITDGPFRLFIESDGHLTTQGEHMYCETYMRVTDDSIRPVARVFLDNEKGTSFIELYEAEYERVFRTALHLTNEEYR